MKRHLYMKINIILLINSNFLFGVLPLKHINWKNHLQIRNQGAALTFFLRSHDSLALYEENGKTFITPWREVLSYDYQLENFHFNSQIWKKNQANKQKKNLQLLFLAYYWKQLIFWLQDKRQFFPSSSYFTM